MKIAEIYQKYSIIPSLQLHMYRVASVGQILAEETDVNVTDVVTVGLLHDMGNIIKFNFDLFPDFFKPEGVDYWRKVQTEYFQKYGHNEHTATLAIAKELNVTDRVIELLLAVGFSQAANNAESHDMEKKIVMYSDMRVEPHGVVSVTERLTDGRKRWKLNHGKEPRVDHFDQMADALQVIEKQIFASISLKPEDITEEIVQKRIHKLHDFEI